MHHTNIDILRVIILLNKLYLILIFTTFKTCQSFLPQTKEYESDSRRETEPENIIQLMMFGCVKNLSSFDSSQPEESESVLSISFENRKIPQKNVIEVHAIYLYICSPISSLQYSK